MSLRKLLTKPLSWRAQRANPKQKLDLSCLCEDFCIVAAVEFGSAIVLVKLIHDPPPKPPAKPTQTTIPSVLGKVQCPRAKDLPSTKTDSEREQERQRERGGGVLPKEFMGGKILK